MKYSGESKCHLLDFELNVPLDITERNSIDDELRQSVNKISETNEFEHIDCNVCFIFPMVDPNIETLTIIYF